MRTLAGLLIVMTILLAGCGFHLRGQASATATQPAMQVVVDDLARLSTPGNWLAGGPGELARILGDTLASAGITQSDDAGIRLVLVSERIDKRVASVDASASAAEYQLDYTLTYRIVGSDGGTLVRDARLQMDRSYRHKSNAIMGSAEEEALLQRDLRRDAAQQLVRRLQRLANAARPAVVPPLDATHAPQP